MRGEKTIDFLAFSICRLLAPLFFPVYWSVLAPFSSYHALRFIWRHQLGLFCSFPCFSHNPHQPFTFPTNFFVWFQDNHFPGISQVKWVWLGFVTCRLCLLLKMGSAVCTHSPSSSTKLTHWCPAVTVVISLQSKNEKDLQKKKENIHFECVSLFLAFAIWRPWIHVFCFFTTSVYAAGHLPVEKGAKNKKRETGAFADLSAEYLVLHCCTTMAFHFKVNASEWSLSFSNFRNLGRHAPSPKKKQNNNHSIIGLSISASGSCWPCRIRYNNVSIGTKFKFGSRHFSVFLFLLPFFAQLR